MKKKRLEACSDVALSISLIFVCILIVMMVLSAFGLLIGFGLHYFFGVKL